MPKNLMKESYDTLKKQIDTCIPHPTTLQNKIERGLRYQPKTLGDRNITILEAREFASEDLETA